MVRVLSWSSSAAWVSGRRKGRAGREGAKAAHGNSLVWDSRAAEHFPEYLLSPSHRPELKLERGVAAVSSSSPRLRLVALLPLAQLSVRTLALHRLAQGPSDIRLVRRQQPRMSASLFRSTLSRRVLSPGVLGQRRAAGGGAYHEPTGRLFGEHVRPPSVPPSPRARGAALTPRPRCSPSAGSGTRCAPFLSVKALDRLADVTLPAPQARSARRRTGRTSTTTALAAAWSSARSSSTTSPTRGASPSFLPSHSCCTHADDELTLRAQHRGLGTEGGREEDGCGGRDGAFALFSALALLFRSIVRTDPVHLFACAQPSYQKSA